MRKLLLKLSLAVFLVLICALFLSELIVPKWTSGNNPQTLQIDDFEKLDSNTLDVLVLGSCQSYQGFNPAVLWDATGRTSYVLASPDQRVYSTYYYLQYALKTQSPKVVLFDTLMLTESNHKNEAFDTKAIFSIPDTELRQRFSEEVFDLHYEKEKCLPQYYIDKGINAIKTRFPVFTFNSTFDFSLDNLEYYLGSLDRSSFNGGVPMFIQMDMSKKSNFMTENCLDGCVLDPIADHYFRKLVDVCEQNGITLILFKTLSPHYWSYEKNDVISDYADSFGLEFIDFNVDPAQFGLDLSSHMYHNWKLNAEGMRITTEYLGGYLEDNHASLFNSEKPGSTIAYYDAILEKYHAACTNATWETVLMPEDEE